MIECVGLFARAGTFELRDVSFAVPRGAHAALAGPSASGKSTLLETIAGAISPSAGTVILGGREVVGLPPELRRVGMVHQQPCLFPHLSVQRNVEYGARDVPLASELMQRFGVLHLRDRGVRALSGGERQLVALCRALAARPDVLLLDEPFSALDAARRDVVRAEYAAIQAEWELTTLQVTHDDRDVPVSTTTRLVMQNGSLSPG